MLSVNLLSKPNNTEIEKQYFYYLTLKHIYFKHSLNMKLPQFDVKPVNLSRFITTDTDTVQTTDSRERYSAICCLTTFTETKRIIHCLHKAAMLLQKVLQHVL